MAAERGGPGAGGVPFKVVLTKADTASLKVLSESAEAVR